MLNTEMLAVAQITGVFEIDVRYGNAAPANLQFPILFYLEATPGLLSRLELLN